MEFSLFYFADDGDAPGNRYELLLEGARFADAHDFAAVWTPERHFHRFGGLFPNPSVTAAAVAAITSRIQIRAGSVVVPLHHVLRIAEEWSVVDNISGGRAGISLASGWNPQDFVFNRAAYEKRRQITVAAIDTLRGLWRGEPLTTDHDAGNGEYTIYPRPVQEELPLWLTTGGSAGTLEAAGRAGVGMLTNLLTYSMDDLPDKIVRYRHAYRESGRPGRGHVVLMVHTYLDEDIEAVDRHVRKPLQRYLLHSLDLNLKAAGLGRGPSKFRPTEDSPVPTIVQRAYERYLSGDGLFGSVEQAVRTVERIRTADVDEIACLIDFGVPTGPALRGLERLAAVRRAAARAAARDPAAARITT
jgi:natural product biosynthesis luciferase-like monooxygenase protein